MVKINNIKMFEEKRLELINELDLALGVLRGIFRNFINDGAINSLDGRVKEVSSVRDKMTSKNKKFSEINDLIGFRFTVAGDDVAKAIGKQINNIFGGNLDDNSGKFHIPFEDIRPYKDIKIDKKSSAKKTDYENLSLIIFDWYKGIHIDKIKLGDILIKSNFILNIEIQIHTMGGKLWSSLVHDTIYKSYSKYDKKIMEIEKTDSISKGKFSFENVNNLSRILSSLSLIDKEIESLTDFHADEIFDGHTFSNIKNTINEKFPDLHIEPTMSKANKWIIVSLEKNMHVDPVKSQDFIKEVWPNWIHDIKEKIDDQSIESKNDGKKVEISMDYIAHRIKDKKGGKNEK